MKIATQYVTEFKSLRKKIQRMIPISKTQKKDTLPEEAIELLIIGVLAEYVSLSEAKSILKRLREEMADYNELRVTSLAEFEELLKGKMKDPVGFGRTLTRTLNGIMDEFDTLDLSFLDSLSKPEIKKHFENIKDCSLHAIAFFLMMRFDINIMPLTEKMLQFLIKCEALPEEADMKTAKAFIERQLKASEIKNFYWLLRKASEMGVSKFKTKPKSTSKKATRKKSKSDKSKSKKAKKSVTSTKSKKVSKKKKKKA